MSTEAMPLVFISYGREDAGSADRLYQSLSDAGFRPWLDRRDILPGQDWREAIESAIAGARYFVLLMSSGSVSRESYAHLELRIALRRLDMFPENQVFFIPARLDDCKPPFRRLLDIQWVDLFPDWDMGVGRLLAAMGTPQGDRPRQLTDIVIPAAPAGLTSISGLIANDRSGTGQLQPNEALGGAVLELWATDPAERLVATVATDANGGYSFTQLPAGPYSIRWVPGTPTHAVAVQGKAGSPVAEVSTMDPVGGPQVAVGSAKPTLLPRWDYERAEAVGLGDTDFTFLWRDSVLRGQVSLNGATGAGVAIGVERVRRGAKGLWEAERHYGRLFAMTAADGSFAFTGLSEGMYSVDAFHPGFPEDVQRQGLALLKGQGAVVTVTVNIEL